MPKKTLKSSKSSSSKNSSTKSNVSVPNTTSQMDSLQTPTNHVKTTQTVTQDRQTKSGFMSRLQDLSNNEDFVRKAVAIVIGIVVLAGTVGVSFYYIPYLLDQTDEAKAVKQQKENDDKAAQTKADQDKQLASETSALKFQDQKVDLNVKDFGDIKIDLKYDAAPKTVESFIRLAYRGYYNNTIFHRIVTMDNFKVIQGGDPKGDGSGGQDAFGSTLPDELWKTKPEYDTSNGQNTLKNTPEFRDPSLYADFDTTNGTVTYRKGLIIMAKTQAPDSAGSQFFITLDKTVLPADYTVFGVIEDESMAVLDKISTEVKPVAPTQDATGQQTSTDAPATDGKPDKELRITTAKII